MRESPRTTGSSAFSLHDALPISHGRSGPCARGASATPLVLPGDLRAVGTVVGRSIDGLGERDRKSTRLNSSHSQISYAVFCLKKKNGSTVTGTENDNMDAYIAPC